MNVKQKLALATVGLLSMANASHAADLMKGTYVGVQGGLAYMNQNSKNTSDADTTDANAGSFSWKSKKKNTSLAFDALIGREMFRMTDDMPVCAEFSFGFNTGSAREKQSPAEIGFPNNDRSLQQLRLRQTWALGLSALIGKEITNDLTAALKLGVVYSNFNTFFGITNDAAFGNDGTKSRNLRLFGFEPGVRLTYKINDCMSTHLQGTYTMYQSKKKTVMNDTDNATSAQTKIAPRIWGLKLGLTYKLGH